ncbi:MAG TPA: hypothetical protein VK158_00890 [Acidobacteriota bacterium]|nr:hypothetical protein [Acidobacteriota bacterium]
MHPAKVSILDAFKSSGLTPLSTTKIVAALYPSQVARIGSVLDDSYSSKDSRKAALSDKAKLHRQLLHHINGLISDGILRVTGVEGKGEKIFAPVVSQNEELVIQSPTKRIVLTARTTPQLPIEGYEAEKTVYRFEPTSWIDKLNAVLIDPTKVRSIDELYRLVSDMLSHVNDVVAINDMEKVIQSYGVHEVIHLLENLQKECSDYNKRLCLILDVTNILSNAAIEQFFVLFPKLNPNRVLTVFDVTARELVMHRDLFERIAHIYARHQMKLNIKNDDFHKAPYIVGKSGPYTISPADWQAYLTAHGSSAFGVSIAQTSVVIDYDRFTKRHPSAKDVQQLIENCTRSLCIANSIQRRDHEDFFRHIISHPLYRGPSFFQLSNCVIRLLHFQSYINSKSVEFPALLSQLNASVKEFTHNQEIIFLSCGMPMRFSVTFAQAYRRFTEATELHEPYQELTINTATDLYSKAMRDTLVAYEQLSGALSGGYEVRFVRSGTANSQEIIGELSLILNTYKIPFFCYRFEVAEGTTIPLTQFMGGA